MLRLLALLIGALAPCATALQAAPFRGQSLSMRRTLTVQMGDVSTKKPNEWKYVKGINDYGKEQTYMYLGPKDNTEDGDSALSRPILDILPEGWNVVLKPYFILLFTPFVLAILATVTGLK